MAGPRWDELERAIRAKDSVAAERLWLELLEQDPGNVDGFLKGADGKITLYDSGWQQQDYIYRFNNSCCFAPLREQMRAIGLNPDDVTDIVVGHGHWDHAGQLDAFPNATLWIQKEELKAIDWALAYPDPKISAWNTMSLGTGTAAGTGYAVELLSGSTVIASVVPVSPPIGSWTTVSGGATTPAIIIAGQLSIRISTTAAQFDFDNIRLDATSTSGVPDGGSFGLLALSSAAGLAGFKRIIRARS